MDGGTAPANTSDVPPPPEASPFICPLCCKADLSAPSAWAKVRSACGHRSCGACLAKWIEREEASGTTASPGCPFCRSPIREKDVRAILGRAFQPRMAVESPRAVDVLDDLTRQWLEEHTATCPACDYSIEKADGCDLIECLCGYRFCFNCGQSHLSGGWCECKPDHEFLEEIEIEDGPVLDAQGHVDIRVCIARRNIRSEREYRRIDIENEEWMRWRWSEKNAAICTENGRWLFSSRTNSACLSMLQQQLDYDNKSFERKSRIQRTCEESSSTIYVEATA